MCTNLVEITGIEPVVTEVGGFTVHCITIDASSPLFWCPRSDSNRHAFRRQNLNLVRLPISPPGHYSSLLKAHIRSLHHQQVPQCPVVSVKLSQLRVTGNNSNNTFNSSYNLAISCLLMFIKGV